MSKIDKRILLASMVELMQHINALIEDRKYETAQESYELLKERAKRLENS